MLIVDGASARDATKEAVAEAVAAEIGTDNSGDIQTALTPIRAVKSHTTGIPTLVIGGEGLHRA